MVNTALRPDATLPEWLSAHARAVTGRRLALDLFGGGLVVAAAALWRPKGWLAAVAAGLCFAAFGAWALAERRLSAHSDEPWPAPSGGDAATAWRAVRTLAALVGALAAVLLGFVLLFGVLGTWIS